MERLGINPADLITRHVTGDWGDLDPEDRGLNERALRDGSRIFSAYGAPGSDAVPVGHNRGGYGPGRRGRRGGRPKRDDDPPARRLLNNKRPPGEGSNNPGGLTTRHETP